MRKRRATAPDIAGAVILVLGIIWVFIHHDIEACKKWPISLDFILPMASGFFFLLGETLRVRRSVEDLELEVQGSLAQLISAVLAARRLAGAASPGNLTTGLLTRYLTWLTSRQEILTDGIGRGRISAADPDYFGFAEVAFSDAKTEIVCTSKVDPQWYDGHQCQTYIEEQAEKLIGEGVRFTRIFFIHREDDSDRRAALKRAVEKQLGLGFLIVLCPTDNPLSERDVASIDDGRLVMEAKVPQLAGQPTAEIDGCYCYLRDANPPADTKKNMHEITDYIKSLLRTRKPIGDVGELEKLYEKLDAAKVS